MTRRSERENQKMARSERLEELYQKRKKEIAPYFKVEKKVKAATAKKRTPTQVNGKKQQRTQKLKKVPKENNRTKPRIESSLDSLVHSLHKLHGVYKEIREQGYYISPSNELVYGRKEAIPLDEAAIQTMESSNVMYNAGITFTILTSLLQDSSMIFFGNPGSGKTTMAEYVSSAIFNLPLKKIQQATLYGHPELTEEKMIAMFDVVKLMNGVRKLVIRDFAKLPVRIIDEVNRIPPAKLSILYQIVDRGWTTYQNEMIIAKPAPLFATANGTDSGNYEMPKPFLDRFDIGIVIQDLAPYHYQEFANKRVNKIRKKKEEMVSLPSRITREDIINFRKLIHNVQFPSDLMSKLAHFSAELKSCDMAGITPDKKSKSNAIYKKPGPLCDSCDHYSQDNNVCSSTENSYSARTISSVFSYAKALAAWRGSRTVNEDDLKYSLSYGSWFKLSPTRKAFNKEPKFLNDRIEWVKDLYDKTRQSYTEVCALIPEYAEITKIVVAQSLYEQGKGSAPRVSRSDIQGLFEKTKEIDSLAKYPLMVTLNNMYLKSK